MHSALRLRDRRSLSLCSARRLFKHINHICRHWRQEIDGHPGVPGLKVIVAEPEVDPGFANTAAADIFHRAEAVAGDIEALTLHGKIQALAQSNHAFSQALSTRCARITLVGSGAAG